MYLGSEQLYSNSSVLARKTKATCSSRLSLISLPSEYLTVTFVGLGRRIWKTAASSVGRVCGAGLSATSCGTAQKATNANSNNQGRNFANFMTPPTRRNKALKHVRT